MSTPYMSELRVFAFSFPPKGWALCNGQQLPINQNQALFSLLGTTYGGNGQTTFALPDLRSRVAVHAGGPQNLQLGQTGGQEAVTLNQSQLPPHTHQLDAASGGTSTALPAGASLGSGLNAYGSASGGLTALRPDAITSTGGSQAHNNLMPTLVLSVCIALQGIFPSRN
jgi:microcystin-dependent protein